MAEKVAVTVKTITKESSRETNTTCNLKKLMDTNKQRCCTRKLKNHGQQSSSVCQEQPRFHLNLHPLSWFSKTGLKCSPRIIS